MIRITDTQQNNTPNGLLTRHEMGCSDQYIAYLFLSIFLVVFGYLTEEAEPLVLGCLAVAFLLCYFLVKATRVAAVVATGACIQCISNNAVYPKRVGVGIAVIFIAFIMFFFSYTGNSIDDLKNSDLYISYVIFFIGLIMVITGFFNALPSCQGCQFTHWTGIVGVICLFQSGICIYFSLYDEDDEGDNLFYYYSAGVLFVLAIVCFILNHLIKTQRINGVDTMLTVNNASYRCTHPEGCTKNHIGVGFCVTLTYVLPLTAVLIAATTTIVSVQTYSAGHNRSYKYLYSESKMTIEGSDSSSSFSSFCTEDGCPNTCLNYMNDSLYQDRTGIEYGVYYVILSAIFLIVGLMLNSCMISPNAGSRIIIIYALSLLFTSLACLNVFTVISPCFYDLANWKQSSDQDKDTTPLDLMTTAYILGFIVGIVALYSGIRNYDCTAAPADSISINQHDDMHYSKLEDNKQDDYSKIHAVHDNNTIANASVVAQPTAPVLDQPVYTTTTVQQPYIQPPVQAQQYDLPPSYSSSMI